MVKQIDVALIEGFSEINLAAAAAFDMANRRLGARAYALSLLSENGGSLRSSGGFEMMTSPLGNSCGDTLIVAAGSDMVPLCSGHLKANLQDAIHRYRRIASICTGAFALADAGLLDNRRATTHWVFARTLQRSYPAVRVDEDRIFIKDGPIWTSAGMAAGIDLSIAMIEEDHGAEIAKSVARYLVVYHRRAGGQSQHSALLELAPKSDRIQAVLDFAKRNLHTDLNVPRLASAANLSPRQFSRIFQAETGRSPARAVEDLRVEAARQMMEEGRHFMDVIARETGFGDRERMRRAFLRAFGQSPQAMRRFRSGDTGKDLVP